MHRAIFLERHLAGNLCSDSGQLLKGTYAFCRKKSRTACVQNCISKMHVQKCIRSKLRSYGGTYRKWLLWHLSSKKIWYSTVPVWWIWEQFTEKLIFSRTWNTFCFHHHRNYGRDKQRVDSNSRFQWWFCMERRRERKTNTKTQKHRGEFFFSSVSFERKSMGSERSVYKVRQSPQLSSQFLSFIWFPMRQSSKCPWSIRKTRKKNPELSACQRSVASYNWVFVPFPWQYITEKGFWFI